MVFSLSCAALTAFWSFVTVSCCAAAADWSEDAAEVSFATFVLSVATAAWSAVHVLEVLVVPDVLVRAARAHGLFGCLVAVQLVLGGGQGGLVIAEFRLVVGQGLLRVAEGVLRRRDGLFRRSRVVVGPLLGGRQV